MISGVKLIDPIYLADKRGAFKKSFYAGAPEEFIVREVFHNISTKNVIRGFHIQGGRHALKKIVNVVFGEIHDVLLDLRPNSKTFLKLNQFTLKDNGPSILIPKGVAHAFRVDSEVAVVNYLTDRFYNSEADTGLRWNSVGYNWDIAEPIVSDRDRDLPDLDQYLKSLGI